MKLSYHYLVVCDDVRREDNGKLLLIGVYGRDIMLSRFPAKLRLGAMLRLTIEEPGETGIEYQCVDRTTGKIFSSKGELGGVDAGIVLLAMPHLVVEFEKPTNLDFQIRQTGEEWQTLVSIAVNATP